MNNRARLLFVQLSGDLDRLRADTGTCVLKCLGDQIDLNGVMILFTGVI